MVGLSLLCALLISVPAYSLTIDFAGTIPGGNVTTDNGDVYGTLIPINWLNVIDNPYGSNASINLVTESGWNSYSYFLEFDTAESFIRVYGVPKENDTLTFVPQYWDLLIGSISNFGFTGPNHFWASGIDSKDEELLSLFDIPTNTKWQFFGFSLYTQDGMAYSTDISNTAVPEPATLLLLGLGLMGVAAIRRKK